VAIQGQGFFQVQMPDGTLAYTRDGSFQKDANGQLVTSSGYPLSPPIQVQSDVLSVTISRDGEVSVLRSGQTAPQAAGNIQLTTFVNPGGLQSMGENLYAKPRRAARRHRIRREPTVPVLLNRRGYVETSNVNVAEELVSNDPDARAPTRSTPRRYRRRIRCSDA
jgi:flagellar basal-body rod protein FlgG